MFNYIELFYNRMRKHAAICTRAGVQKAICSASIPSVRANSKRTLSHSSNYLRWRQYEMSRPASQQVLQRFQVETAYRAEQGVALQQRPAIMRFAESSAAPAHKTAAYRLWVDTSPTRVIG